MHRPLRLSHGERFFTPVTIPLYRNRKNDSYLLILKMDQTSVKVSTGSATLLPNTVVSSAPAAGGEAYFKEHYELVAENNALQTLAAI